MLKLEKLTLSAVGRLVDEQTIDFTQLSNLIQVDGQNKNTGGSSGAGKSTIFNALDYLLGLNNIPNSVLQSRLTKETIEVTGYFKYNDLPLKIQRGKKLLIDLNGEVTTGNAALAEERLDRILGMPRELFRPMLHKRQKEGGFFLALTPKETHEFLTDGLGLNDLKKQTSLAEAKVTELTDTKTKLSSQLAMAKAGLEATQNALSALGDAPQRDMHQETVLELKGKLDVSLKALEALKVQQSLERSAVDLIRARQSLELQTFENKKPKPVVIPFDTSTLKALEQELPTIRDKAQALLTDEQHRQIAKGRERATLDLLRTSAQNDIRIGKEAAAKVSKVAEEIKKIRSSICPTCEQNWATDQAKAKENELLDQLKKLKELITYASHKEEFVKNSQETLALLTEEMKPRIPEEISALQVREQELSSLIFAERAKEKDHNTYENDKVRALLSIFATEQAKLSAAHAVELQSADPSFKHSKEIEHFAGQVDLDRRTFEVAANKLRNYQEAAKRYESSFAQLKKQEDEARQKMLESDRNLIFASLYLDVAEEIKKAVKSYTSCLFDDALEYIGDSATKIIRSIPNMANATIQLEGVRETKAGKIKEEVNAVIHMDGEEGVPIKSLSGGERSSVDLAVDLAVIDLLENKSGKGIDIFILDEPFTGLDTVSVEMALEVLKNSNLSKRLVVVDHNPVIKEFISDKITVVREGERSRIEV